MLLAHLLYELRRLSRVEKFLALQILIEELSLEDLNQLFRKVTYELFTPYGNETAAQALALYLENNQTINAS